MFCTNLDKTMAMPKECSIEIDLPEEELMEVDNETEDEIEIATRSVWRVDNATAIKQNAWKLALESEKRTFWILTTLKHVAVISYRWYSFSWERYQVFSNRFSNLNLEKQPSFAWIKHESPFLTWVAIYSSSLTESSSILNHNAYTSLIHFTLYVCLSNNLTIVIAYIDHVPSAKWLPTSSKWWT